jgi:two-component system OmpR family sensor kinase
MKREPSLVRPLILALTGAIILFWLGAIGLSIVVMRHELDEVFDSALQETAERLLALVTDDMELRTKEDEGSITISESSGGREYLTYQVRLASGTILLRSKDAPSAPFDVPLNAGFHDAETRRIYTAVSADGLLYLQAADRFSNRREAVRESAVTMLIPLAVLVPVSVLAI